MWCSIQCNKAFVLRNSCREAVLWLRRLVAGLSPRRPGFDPGSVHVGFVVDKVALGQDSTSVFPCQFHSTGAPLQGKTKKLNIFITGLHNKHQGCGESVASAAGPFTAEPSLAIILHSCSCHLWKQAIYMANTSGWLAAEQCIVLSCFHSRILQNSRLHYRFRKGPLFHKWFYCQMYKKSIFIYFEISYNKIRTNGMFNTVNCPDFLGQFWSFTR
jgi:hypothetical protein